MSIKTKPVSVHTRDGAIHVDAVLDISTQCLSCTHFKEEFSCKAFPNGIPEVIISGEFDHKNKFPNDKGLRFTIKENSNE